MAESSDEEENSIGSKKKNVTCDLECGTKINNVNVDEGEGDSSAKRVLIHLDLWGLCRTPMDLPQSGVEALSETKNGGIESENLNVKPSGKKPPRPPRLPKTCEDRDRVIKAALRRAKLEKLLSLKKKQIHKSKTSASSLWALACTLCFCVIMLIQGLFSQGNSSAQITPAVPVRTETFHVHKYDNHAAKSDAIIQDQPSSSLRHFEPALDKARPDQSDLKT